MKIRRPKLLAPETVTATLVEACERVAYELEQNHRGLISIDRRDAVALVAACGWNLTLEQTRADEPGFQDEAMFE